MADGERITYGQPLSASTLTGGSAWVGSTPVAGSFTFTSPTTVPNAGSYSASVTFTPNDLINYNTVNGSVSVVVAQASPTVSGWPTAERDNHLWTAALSRTLSGGSASVPAPSPSPTHYCARCRYEQLPGHLHAYLK